MVFGPCALTSFRVASYGVSEMQRLGYVNQGSTRRLERRVQKVGQNVVFPSQRAKRVEGSLTAVNIFVRSVNVDENDTNVSTKVKVFCRSVPVVFIFE